MSTKILPAAVATFLLTLALIPPFIRVMRRRHYGQQIREVGPDRHALKAGTPTMGGIIFIPAALLVSLILIGPTPLLAAALLVTFGCGLVGFLDDFGKIARARSLGLKARAKIFGEILITLFLVLLLRSFGLYSTEIFLPFAGTTVDLGWFYPLFVFIVISASSNSVNLTDGLDGLAAGVCVAGFAAFAVIAYHSGITDVVVFCSALAGGCLGFLVFNRYPARIFMGDSGSLALGGAFAAAAILTGLELFLVVIGGVFVIEALTVIIQVISFRLTGKRVFLMSPLHHHFEMKGWSEWRVVGLFWSAAIVMAAAGVLTYRWQVV